VPGRGARCVVTSAATDSGEEGLRFNSKRCVVVAMRGPKPHSCRYSANGLRSSLGLRSELVPELLTPAGRLPPDLFENSRPGPHHEQSSRAPTDGRRR